MRLSPTPRSSSSSSALSPAEETLQSLCKQLLKSRIFRGYYRERRYVDAAGGYRDIIALQNGEKELERLLLDMQHKLRLFYQHLGSNIWIGITHGTPADLALEPGALETCVWAELSDLAFGQYWFTIKSVRFREREIVLKLKMLRPIDAESPGETRRQRRRLSSTSSVATSRASAERAIAGADHPAVAAAAGSNIPVPANIVTSTSATSSAVPGPGAAHNAGLPELGFADFVALVNEWGASIKQTVYDFMSNDISKDNIKGLLRFLGLLIVSLLSGLLMAIRLLGIFVLRFMFEFSRLTLILTPIILKIIEVANKIIGGIFILLAMVWGDVVRGRRPKENFQAIEYNRPLYKSIKYDVQQQQQQQEQAQMRRPFVFGKFRAPQMDADQ